jgi:hypothetical protein
MMAALVRRAEELARSAEQLKSRRAIRRPLRLERLLHRRGRRRPGLGQAMHFALRHSRAPVGASLSRRTG